MCLMDRDEQLITLSRHFMRYVLNGDQVIKSVWVSGIDAALQFQHIQVRGCN